MADTNLRPGSYPTADKAAVFGDAFNKFYDAWSAGADLERIWPYWCRLRNWSLPRARRHAPFAQWYDAFVEKRRDRHGDAKLSLADLDEIIYHVVDALEKLAMWDWARAWEDEETIHVAGAAPPPGGDVVRLVDVPGGDLEPPA